MKRVLTIDQGNSRVKATLLEGLNVVETIKMDHASIEDIADLAARWMPQGVVYESVGHIDARFVESLRMLFPASLLVLTHSTPLPIGVDYATPGTLGLDRVAAAVGASALYPGKSMLVVDAGTALTLDVVDPSPAFRGGNISPGVSMRLRALSKFTRSLPLVEPTGEIPQFGFSTETAILAGCVRGVAAEIAEVSRSANKIYNTDLLLLTGGEASVVFPYLNDLSMPVVLIHELVAIGLSRIYQYNEDI